MRASMPKRLVPPLIAVLLAVVPASAWAAANGGVSASTSPLPSASQGGTAYGSVPVPVHRPKKRKRTRPKRPPAPAAPAAPAAPGPSAVLSGTAAVAPAGAPATVKAAIAAANRIQGLPYRFGGGHASFVDTAYDCSGTVSFMLHGAGLLASPLDSTELMSWGLPGPGRWISIYSTPGHAYAVVAGLRLDTSGSPSGPRWRALPRTGSAFTVRHPAGL
jgi:cell wall-associated NlpC family hydrolase